MRVKTLTILFFLLMIPLPLSLNRRKTRLLTVGTLRQILRKSKIISRDEIRKICRVYRTKLRKGEEIIRKDVLDIIVVVVREKFSGTPEYITGDEFRAKLTQVWQNRIKGTDETDFSESGFDGYWEMEISPEELLSKYRSVLTTFVQYGLLTEEEKSQVNTPLHDYQILFRPSLFEHCRLAMSK